MVGMEWLIPYGDAGTLLVKKYINDSKTNSQKKSLQRVVQLV